MFVSAALLLAVTAPAFAQEWVEFESREEPAAPARRAAATDGGR
jgi:hypothetical protein